MYAGDSFEQDDALGRKKYAEFIVDMIRNGAEYLQEDDTKSFSIAIDSAYGTGKTVFLRKLEALLKDHKYASESIDVIHYNAWEVDYTGDAFGAMKDAVLDTIPFLYGKCRERLKEALRSLKGAAVSIATHYNPLGGAAAEAIADVVLPEESEGRKLKKAMCAWQAAFANAMEESGTLKLVVIIDELDRCRPDFAIQTLEIAKHLMNVENVVFVYALDMQQLCSAVRAAYGDSIDANGYLCKLFNYVTKLPLPSVDGYVRAWVEGGVKDTHLKAYFESCGLMAYFVKLATTMHVTLRQIDVIMRTYIIMYKQFLCRYRASDAQKIYLYFVFLKYARSDLFDALFLGRGKINSDAIRDVEWPHRRLDKMWREGNRPIKQLLYDERKSVEVNATSGEVFLKFRPEAESPRVYTYSGNEKPEVFDETLGCLFYPDFLKYEEIQELSLASYIHQNMEMFFFAIPDGNTDSVGE